MGFSSGDWDRVMRMTVETDIGAESQGFENAGWLRVAFSMNKAKLSNSPCNVIGMVQLIAYGALLVAVLVMMLRG